ncbi:hypothetical protein GCM10027265_30280 [Jatrophihabitans fulvus]
MTVVPPQTRTVTKVVVPDYGSGPSVNGSFSDEFVSSRQVDASAYSSGGTVYFSSPSGNIGCRIVGYGSRVECTITDYLFSEPGYDCDNGAGVLMYEASSPSIDCVGYTYSGDRALPYGYSVVNGDMACVSRSDGITCADMTTGDAFRLSRESYDSTY